MLLNHLEYVAEKIGLDKVGFGLDRRIEEDEISQLSKRSYRK